MNKESFSDRLKRARETLGITQSELSETLGVEPTTVSRWEGGQSHPAPKRIKAIARALNRSVDWLVGLEKDIDPGTPDISALEARIKALETLSLPVETVAELGRLRALERKLKAIPPDILGALLTSSDFQIEGVRSTLRLPNPESDKKTSGL